jgi:spore coat protein U-like protein
MSTSSLGRRLTAVAGGLAIAAGVATLALAQAPGGQAGGGSGGQTSANMQVNADVIRKCTIAAQPLAFGDYDPVSANATAALDAQTTLSVACTKGTAVTIAMDNGSNAQGRTRRMTGGPATFLQYEVYRDSSRTQRWGDGAFEQLDGGTAPSRDPRQFIVYGRVTGSQDVTQGTYQDTILVTVQF